MSDLIARLIAAGTPADLVADVAMELGRMRGELTALDRRRQADRDRQRNKRDADRHDGNVTSRDNADVTDTPPALDKETSPRPPKEINPTPRVNCGRALARKAGGFGPPDNVSLDSWNAFASQRKKPITEISYARMLKTLAECADVGWPPGEIVDRAIERGWETLFTPTEPRNGRQQQRNSDGIGPTTRAALDWMASN